MTPDSHYQTDAGRERFSLAFIVASVAMASVTYGIGRYAYGLFIPEIRRDFALDTFTLGLIASVGTVIYLLSNIVASAIAASRFRNEPQAAVFEVLSLRRHRYELVYRHIWSAAELMEVLCRALAISEETTLMAAAFMPLALLPRFHQSG